MNKITCDIIRDLLPSYTDGIASDDSVKLVEEHLAQCSACAAFKDRMGKPDLRIADKTDNLDYLKKIRKITDLKSAVCFLSILITGAFFLGYARQIFRLESFFPFFVLVAVMLLCNYLLFFHNNETKDIEKIKETVPSAISVLLILYMMLIMQLSFYNWLHNKNAPFNIDYAELGPFLHKQLLLTMVIEIGLWIRELVLHIRKAHFSIISSSLGIIGFYMSLYYDQMLKTISTLDGFHVINNHALLLFAEGIGILLLLFMVEKIKERKYYMEM
ncbi:MAG: zf-HC2 domain-containing protein [Lachnospiraceae bacterium]|nr:zf-HC2 domain-containing protein [Lachnospiraceae bacterium]